ncbi:MAG: AtpZ/AtpI family protein [Calditrichia bacterium]|nr:AtpZ/AtpI family protein [Calditrichia bacterium]
MAISLLFWLGIGYLIDSKFETQPLFFFIGVVFGLLSVFYELYKLIKISIKMEKNEKVDNES